MMARPAQVTSSRVNLNSFLIISRVRSISTSVTERKGALSLVLFVTASTVVKRNDLSGCRSRPHCVTVHEPLYHAQEVHLAGGWHRALTLVKLTGQMCVGTVQTAWSECALIPGSGDTNLARF